MEKTFATQLHTYRLSAGPNGTPVNHKRMVEILSERIKNPLLKITQLKYHRWENGKVVPSAEVQGVVLQALKQ